MFGKKLIFGIFIILLLVAPSTAFADGPVDGVGVLDVVDMLLTADEIGLDPQEMIQEGEQMLQDIEDNNDAGFCPAK